MATGCSLPNRFPQAELEEATGSAPVAWEAVASRGYGRINAHWRVELADGRRTFAKVALDELAAGWLRDEHRIYPGDGIAPLTDLLRDLRAIGFRGMLSLELFNREYWKQDPLEVAKTGLAKMKAVASGSV